MNQLMILDFAWLNEFLQYFKSWKESIEARNDANYKENAKSKMFNSCQSYEGLQYFTKKSVNFSYNKVSLIFFQKDFVRMILKIILVNNVLLVLDMIIKTVHDFGYNDNTDPLEEMSKVLQKSLMKYVMNLCQSKENEIWLKKIIVAWQLDKSGTTNFKHQSNSYLYSYISSQTLLTENLSQNGYFYNRTLQKRHYFSRAYFLSKISFSLIYVRFNS